MNDRRITIREVANDVDILVGSCHDILLNFIFVYIYKARQYNQ